jgi:hypothetical protein
MGLGVSISNCFFMLQEHQFLLHSLNENGHLIKRQHVRRWTAFHGFKSCCREPCTRPRIPKTEFTPYLACWMILRLKIYELHNQRWNLLPLTTSSRSLLSTVAQCDI